MVLVCGSDDSVTVEVKPVAGAAAAADDDADDVARAAGSAPRQPQHRVQLWDDVIDRVAIFKDSEGHGGLTMHVDYHRPWWSYVLAVVSVVLTGVAWSATAFGSHSVPERTSPYVNPHGGGGGVGRGNVYATNLQHHHADDDLSAADASSYNFHATLKLFTYLYTGSFLLVAIFLIFSWQLSWRDHRDLRKPRLVLRLALCSVTGGLAKLLFVLSLMLVITTTHIVIYGALPFVFISCHRFVIGRHRVLLDMIGGALILAGSAILFAGEIEEQRNSTVAQRSGAFVAAITAAALEAIHRVSLKYLRPFFSHRMVLSGMMTSTCVMLLIFAAASSSLDAPSGRHRATRGLQDMDAHSLIRIAVSIVALCASAFLDLDTASFFDVLTYSALGTVLCPIAIALFHVFELPHTKLGYEIGSCLAVGAGMAAVLWSGMRHRRRVRLTIVTRE